MRTSVPSRGVLQAPYTAGAGPVPDTSVSVPLSLPLPNLFLTLRVREAFAGEPALKNASIAIDVLDGVLYLDGVVGARYQQMIAIHVASGVKGVQEIRNRIRVVSRHRESR